MGFSQTTQVVCSRQKSDVDDFAIGYHDTKFYSNGSAFLKSSIRLSDMHTLTRMQKGPEISLRALLHGEQQR